MYHAVGLGDGTHHAAGHTAGEGIGGDVLGHHAACADDAAIADGNTGTDDDTCSQPAVVADGDGAGVAQAYPLTLAVEHLPPLGAKILSVFTLELLAKNASVATLALLAVSETPSKRPFNPM